MKERGAGCTTRAEGNPTKRHLRVGRPEGISKRHAPSTAQTTPIIVAFANASMMKRAFIKRVYARLDSGSAHYNY